MLEPLEMRLPLSCTAASVPVNSWHNASCPPDVNADDQVTPQDALLVVNELTTRSDSGLLMLPAVGTGNFVDVDDDGFVSPRDAILVVNELYPRIPNSPLPTSAGSSGSDYAATFNEAVQLGSQNLLTESDVETLLQRASMASPSEDAIIAVVDRTGRILGVRVESGVSAALQADADNLAYAIDGAVAKARTAAFFSSNAAPLPSRTIRFISQSTVTQREVESSPIHADPAYVGPGFVAPIGVGGHFPPEVAFTPQVDLFAIEHQSRDSQLHPGLDGVKGTADDFSLTTRFNVAPDEIASGAEDFFASWPESYGFQSQTSINAQSRGIATLPGGIPLFKVVTDADGNVQMRPGKTPALPDINLVGGIGVFFPGEDGFATHEQNFVHASQRNGIPQTEFERNNAARVLESEFVALVAAAGDGTLVGPSAFVRDLSSFTDPLPPLSNFVAPTGRIDLVGITLEIYGPTPSPEFRLPGIDRLIDVGKRLNGPGVDSGSDVIVGPGTTYLAGQAVPEGWLVEPHDAADGSLTAAQVHEIIDQGVDRAGETRAAIRLDIDNNFRPGERTRMILAVADKDGNVLGLFRMPDATVFSIDVSVAKARNTAYYADASDLQTADRIDFDGDGVFGPISTSLNQFGDTVPAGTALTNRTFRFLVEPRYPTGIELNSTDDDGLVNDASRDLCDQRPSSCQKVAPQSILRMPGINPLTAENLVNDDPLPASIYADPASKSVLAFDAFNVSRNFRDPGDASVVIAGTGISQPLANQNGIVFFPGSAPLYVDENLAGGFGVSGDGVDQDDVVTASGFVGFETPDNLRIDAFTVGFVRLPYVKFNRNPLGP